MFTGWNKRRKIHVEGKTSLVLKRLVILGPAERRERGLERFGGKQTHSLGMSLVCMRNRKDADFGETQGKC